MWRTHTVYPPRYIARRVGKGPLRLTIPPKYSWERFISSMADLAEQQDMKCWFISSSVEEYECRKRQRVKRLKREEDEKKGKGSFPQFEKLPPEVRLMVWEMAMQQPTTVSVHETEGLSYTARARLPPLMLACRESHAIASKHYRRTLRNFRDDGGGVLAAYPIDIHVNNRVFLMMRWADFAEARDIIVDVGEEGPEPKIVYTDKLDKVIRAPFFRSLELRYGSGKATSPSWFESFLPEVLSKIKIRNLFELDTHYTRVTRKEVVVYKEGEYDPTKTNPELAILLGLDGRYTKPATT
ncbi:hypothetical protein F5Y10DRAFT_112904 [Nemania abortiva]|nr:hypothetical protein F5Y10DRAFT_112904 [Nemania abortiva]